MKRLARVRLFKVFLKKVWADLVPPSYAGSRRQQNTGIRAKGVYCFIRTFPSCITTQIVQALSV